MTEDELVELQINNIIKNWKQDPSLEPLEIEIDGTKIFFTKVIQKAA